MLPAARNSSLLPAERTRAMSPPPPSPVPASTPSTAVNRVGAARAGLAETTVLLLVGFSLMLQPLSTDLYLASLPGLTRYFDTSVATVQLTLSVFIVGFGTMQLISGPLSDRFGRYPVLLAGLSLYVAASVGCALAPTIAVLIAGRFLQAVGCCTAVVIARAVIRDLYDPLTGARKFAQASSLLAAGPLLGPIAGSYLEVTFGWRAAFVVVALISAGLLAATFAKLNETNALLNPAATRPSELARTYARVLRSKEFRAYTLLAIASFGGLFAFISGSPFVLIRVLGVPTQYFGYCFASAMIGYLVGTVICRRLLARRGVRHTLAVGAIAAAGGALAMGALSLAGVHHFASILVPQFVYMLSHGINFPCAQVGAVAPFPGHAGAAAGLLGFLTMVAAAGVGWWIGGSDNGTVYPLTLTIAACGLIVFVTVFGLLRERSVPAAR